MLAAMQSPRTEQFVALAGLRGVAALVVLQWHGKNFLGGPWLPSGYLAVDFFFLLSGWVLAHAYDHKLQTGLSALGFLKIRLIRLYPVYLFAFLLVFVSAAMVGHPPIAGLLFGLVFLPNFLASPVDWLVRPAWSLTAEVIANLPFGFWHRHLTESVLVGVVAAAFIGLLYWALSFGSLDVGHSLATWPGLFARVFFSFPLGILLYRKRSAIAAWAPRWALVPACVFLVVALAVPAPPEIRGPLDLATVALLLPMIVLFASAARPGAVATRIANAAGNASYPLYLLHMNVFAAASIVLQVETGHDLDSAPLRLTLPLIGGIIVASLLVHRLYDEPVRNWLSGAAAPASRLASAPGAASSAGNSVL